jgi:transposase
MDKTLHSNSHNQSWEEEKVSLLSRDSYEKQVAYLKEIINQKDQQLSAHQKILEVKENIIFLNTQKLEAQEELLKKSEEALKEKDETIKILVEDNNILKEYLQQAKQAMFGKKSEKASAIYPSLPFTFKDRIFNEPPEKEEDKKEEVKRNRGKRKPLPEHLPRKKVILDLPDNEKVCDCCGHALHKIRDEINEQLEVIPEHVIVKQQIRGVYGCKGCSKTMKTVTLPDQIIPKSFATPSLLSYIIMAKYCHHLPLYRQEQIWKRYGVDLDQSTLARWIMTIGDKVSPLIELMKRDLLKGDYIQADETTLQVLADKEKSKNAKSYMWVYKTGGNKPSPILYTYADTREGINAKDFLKGFKGYLQTDAYSGYKTIQDNDVIHAGCMAHARRKFADIVKTTKQKDTLAHQALLKIAKLYKIEEEIKDLDPGERKRRRDEKATPILNDFKKWLDHYAEKVPPKGPIGKAIAYARNNWTELKRYLDDGRIEIDNNATERCIKPFALGRRNWLFAGNVKSAKAAANLYSLIETCKSHNLNPYNYMKDILEKLANPKIDLTTLVSLLPYNWKPKETED